jgi:molybdenum cofactor guanylyltransferase
MGRDKALLPFGSKEVLLQRVVRLVGEVVPYERIVCVAARGQMLPRLPADVMVVRDEYPDRGPLAGLATGMGALAGRAEAVFACGCDSPLLVPALARRLLELLADHQAIAPEVDGILHPLTAVYRIELLPVVRELLAASERSLTALLEQADTRLVTADQLRDVDAELVSLINCNSMAEYQQALQLAISPTEN